MNPTHKRSDVVYLDKDTIAHELQSYMDCRDGVVLEYGFYDDSGYGTEHKAYYCTNSKSESSSLIIYHRTDKKWMLMHNICFDNDSWDIIKDLLNSDCTKVIRNYNHA